MGGVQGALKAGAELVQVSGRHADTSGMINGTFFRPLRYTLPNSVWPVERKSSHACLRRMQRPCSPFFR